MSARQSSRSPRNVLEGDWPGCHVAHGKVPWILGLQDLQSAGLRGNLPDLSIDPKRKVLSVINAKDDTRCFYISVFCPCYARSHRFSSGQVRRGDGSIQELTTFVLVVPPTSIMDVCKVQTKDVRSLELHSDIVVLKPSTSPCAENPKRYGYGFPLEGGPYKCSQGHGGKLTHFAHPSTYYALDFDCPVGTPVLAMQDGVVTQRRDDETVSGIDVENFFKWNQLTIHQSDGMWAEYVHLQAAVVDVGDLVTRGQQIARSGDVGFCPTAHLHVARDAQLLAGRR
eukprot:symbB.v1.2.000153.t1/scaffold9.1/size550961/9